MAVLFGVYSEQSFPFIYTNKRDLTVQCALTIIVSYILGFQCSMLAEYPGVNIDKAIRQHLRSKKDKSDRNNELKLMPK